MEADRHRCRFVVSGSEKRGFVSLSDLQSLPVRAALIEVIVHAEITMTSDIRCEFNGVDGWIDRLSRGHQWKVEGKSRIFTTADSFLDSLLFTLFTDEVTNMRQSPLIESGKIAINNDTGDVEKVGNLLVPWSSYVSSQAATEYGSETARSINQWACWLISWPARSDVPGED